MGRVGSGQVRVVNVHVQSMQNASGRVGSEWLTCTFGACRKIRVGSGQSIKCALSEHAE